MYGEQKISLDVWSTEDMFRCMTNRRYFQMYGQQEICLDVWSTEDMFRCMVNGRYVYMYEVHRRYD
jgi:hypothetical protein